MNTRGSTSILFAAIVVVVVVITVAVSQLQYALAVGATEFSPGIRKNAEGIRDASESSPGSQVNQPTDPYRDASQFSPGQLFGRDE